MSRSETRRRGRALLSLLAAVVAMLSVVTAPASAAPHDPPTTKIEQAVTQSLAAKDSANYWVLFTETADLSGPSAIRGWAARGTAVVDTLRRTADRSQTAVRALLDAQRISYKPFHIANAIMVEGGSTALAESLAKSGDVASIVAPRNYTIPMPIPGTARAEVNAVEWGIAAINADDVWSTYGARGDGIVVANIDSGVEYSHPALVGKYRGNLGNGTFDHNYNWFDPAGMSSTCGGPSPVPCDTNIDFGHGTPHHGHDGR